MFNLIEDIIVGVSVVAENAPEIVTKTVETVAYVAENADVIVDVFASKIIDD